MTKLYSDSPLAIEIKALVNDANQQPVFAWITITSDSIESVSQAQTQSGGGATVRLKSGAMLLVSNSYSDVSDALLGDAKRFLEDDAVEAEILAGSKPVRREPMDDIADVAGVRGLMGLDADDGEDDDDDLYVMGSDDDLYGMGSDDDDDDEDDDEDEDEDEGNF